jgi:hypothetical protein
VGWVDEGHAATAGGAHAVCVCVGAASPRRGGNHLGAARAAVWFADTGAMAFDLDAHTARAVVVSAGEHRSSRVVFHFDILSHRCARLVHARSQWSPTSALDHGKWSLRLFSYPQRLGRFRFSP